MWILEQPGASKFVRKEVSKPTVDDVGDGELLLEFLFGSICGSDIPKFRGHMDPDNPYTGLPGVPLHELVGRVVESKSPRFDIGDRVVGIVAQSRGLAEYIVNPSEFVSLVPDELSSLEASIIQPVATVLSSYSRVGDLSGKSVAILGLGPLGLLFAHVAKSLGASQVIGVDIIDRSDVAEQFGIDKVVASSTEEWSVSVSDWERPDIVVDAIGHQSHVVEDAVIAAKPGGSVLVFGLPEDYYQFPMRQFFRKGLTMAGGATESWQKYLSLAAKYVVSNDGLRSCYMTDVFPVSRAEEAFEKYALPAVGRVKVGLYSDF